MTRTSFASPPAKLPQSAVLCRQSTLRCCHSTLRCRQSPFNTTRARLPAAKNATAGASALPTGCLPSRHFLAYIAPRPCTLRHDPANCVIALHTAPRPCTLRHGPAACVMAPQTASSPCKLRHGPAHCVMNLQIASWPGVARPPTTWLWGQAQSWVAGTRLAMTRTSIAGPSHVPQSALHCCQSAQATCHQSATKPHATRAPKAT